MAAAVVSVLAAGASPSGGPARAQTDLDALVRQVRQSQCREGLEALAALASGDDLEAKRASYLLGWCQLRAGRYADAVAAYRSAAGHPSLRSFARIGEAQALGLNGEPAAAARLARETAEPAKGDLRARALVVLGEAELALKRPARAASALASAAELRSSDPAVWRLLGEAAETAGRRDVARLAYARAGWAFPGDPAEASARQALARLLGRPVRAADIDPESHLLRGRRLAQQGEWEQARAEFRAATAAPRGPVAGEAWFRLGEIHLHSDPASAHLAFRRAALMGWNVAAAWFWVEVSARRAGMAPQARDAAKALLRVAPVGPWTGRYWFNAGRRAEGAGRSADAGLLYRRAIDAAPTSDDAVEARWRLGWLALRAGRFTDAEARFRLAGQTAPWRSAAARGWYWAAKTIESSGNTGRGEEAARIVRMVAEQYPLTFYGQRARARLGLPAPSLPPALPYAAQRVVAAAVHEELFRLGFDADAAKIGEEALATRREPRLARFLAQAYARLGDIPQSVAHAEDALARGVRDEDTWRLAYPRAYWTEVTAAAQAAGIDPLFLLALVREESRYDAAAISPARAVGLAQLLPPTARAISGDPGISIRRLTDPATNLSLGARYIRLQMDRFGGDLRLTLAAYNAGPGAARQWMGLDADPDYFVERIGFAETRAYIRRVLGSYGIYKLLW